MSLSSKLQLGDNSLEVYSSEYSVVECRYEMTKIYNESMRSAETKSNMAKIELTVVAPMAGDFTLYNWYSEMMSMNGRIVIDLSSILVAYSDKSCKRICFEDACCISIAESYNIEALSRRELTVVLLAKRLVIDTVDLNVKIVR